MSSHSSALRVEREEIAVETPDNNREPSLSLKLGRMIERMHRRYLDLIRIELQRLGVEEINPVQALMVLHIGDDEMSVRELMERGHYIGNNASYNLKSLTEQGYLDRSCAVHDRRAARIKLSERGKNLRAKLICVEQRHMEAMFPGTDELMTTYRTLRRLERSWSERIRNEIYDDYL